MRLFAKVAPRSTEMTVSSLAIYSKRVCLFDSKVLCLSKLKSTLNIIIVFSSLLGIDIVTSCVTFTYHMCMHTCSVNINFDCQAMLDMYNYYQ